MPAMFCNCVFCKKIREAGPYEFRTRTQVLIDDKICLDFPPEAYVHSLVYGINYSSLEYLLVTHSHMDHFYAHDFILRGYKYAAVAAKTLNIYGNEEVQKVFSECTAREMKPEVAPNLKFTPVKAFSEFFVGDYRVLAVPARHGTAEEALLYYVEKDKKGYLHMHDTGRLGDDVFLYLAQNGARAGAVSLDCTFLDGDGGENARHMGLNDDEAMRAKLREFGIADDNTRFILTHFSHNSNPLRERTERLAARHGMTAAYDGFETDF